MVAASLVMRKQWEEAVKDITPALTATRQCVKALNPRDKSGSGSMTVAPFSAAPSSGRFPPQSRFGGENSLKSLLNTSVSLLLEALRQIKAKGRRRRQGARLKLLQNTFPPPPSSSPPRGNKSHDLHLLWMVSDAVQVPLPLSGTLGVKDVAGC